MPNHALYTGEDIELMESDYMDYLMWLDEMKQEAEEQERFNIEHSRRTDWDNEEIYYWEWY